MIPRITLLLCAAAASCLAAPRTWTDAKGRRIEAEFVSQTPDKVVLKMAATGKNVTLEKSLLSAPDQEFLKTAQPATATGAPATGRASFSGQPYDSARLDKSKWQKLTPARDLKIRKVEFPQQIETPHFFLAGVAGVKPAVMDTNADVCERLYSHMVRLLPHLDTTFKDRRMPIWLTSTGDEMMSFGSWLQSEEGGYFSGSPTTAICSGTMPAGIAGEQKFLRPARLLRGDAPNVQKPAKWGDRIFFIGGTALYAATWDVKENDGNNFGMLNLGWSYFLESDICGNITTEVTFGSGSSVEGFKNGRTWPATIKGIIKNGAKPGAARLLQTKKQEAQPIDVGMAFGFCHWCFKDAARAKQFNDMLAAAVAATKAPDPETFAKAFGFASVEAFDKAFLDYLTGDRFQ